MHSETTTQSSAAVGSQDEVLGRLALALEGASDLHALVRQFVAEFPQHAEAIRRHAAMEQAVRQAAPASPHGHLQPGQQLGAFTIKGFITAGGMGEIYEALQRDLNRRVALKVIRPDLAGDRTTRRFHREREVLARLHQTHIVPVFAAGQESGLEYVAMQLIEGASLGHVVQAILAGETAASGLSTASSLANVARELQNRSRSRSVSPEATTAENPPKRSLEKTPQDEQTAAGGKPTLPAAGAILSQEYFRSVAEAMEKAAQAVQTAHDLGVCHRDLKPSNLMIEPSGKCWLIDFGLASQPAGPAAEEGRLAGDGGLTLHWLGTPAYMAPEQFDLHGDPRLWDVRALGATLYELICLQPPLGRSPSREEAQTNDPQPPRTINPRAPRDLCAICMKSLARNPGDRYATPAAFGDDLRRWLDGHPTRARPGWLTLRPARLWAWRNKALAFALAMLAGAVLLVLQANSQGKAAARRALHAKAQLLESTKTALQLKRREVAELERGMLLMEATQIRLSPRRRAGWRQEVISRLETARPLRTETSDLRTLAAAAFAGIDATLIRRSAKEPTAWVALDATGERLLIAPTKDAEGDKQFTRIWNATTGEVEGRLSRRFYGPVAFRDDGAAVQLALMEEDPPTVSLWNVAKNEVVRVFALPEGARPRAAETLQGLAVTLTGNANFFAMALDSASGEKSVGIWSADKIEPIAMFSQPGNQLALDRHAGLLAVGDGGAVSVWSVAEKKLVATFTDDSSDVTAVAFGERPYLRRSASESPVRGSQVLLATANAAGRIMVWDLHTRLPLAICRGSYNEVFALQFTGDGQYLLSAGRGWARMWDVCRGEILLEIPTQNYVCNAVVSGDQRRIALASPPIIDEGACEMFEIENGRGIPTFYGLDSRALRVLVSPTGKRLAALSQTWQLAVWDLASGRLELVADAPTSLFADHAALAFSPDEKMITCIAESQAVTWDIQNKRETDVWAMNPGLINRSAVDADGVVLVSRVETEDGRTAPYSNARPEAHPRRCRIWKLLPGGKRELVSQITDFPRHIEGLFLSPEGRHIVIQGLNLRGRIMDIASYDVGRGERIWPLPPHVPANPGIIELDPTGQFLAYLPDTVEGSPVLLKMPEGVLHAPLNGRQPRGLGPEARMVFSLTASGELQGGIEIRRTEEETPIVVLDQGTGVQPLSFGFDRSGRHFHWGLDDGPVRMADLFELRRRLTQIHLEW